MFRSKRLLAGATVAALACAGLATTAGARTAGGTDPHDSGTSWFSVTHTVNGVEHAAGQASDKVFGNTAITYLLKTVPTTPGTLAITSNSVTLYTAKGSLSGTATATLTINPSGVDTITGGKLKLAKGTGALKGDKLSATFSGTGNPTANQYQITYTGKLSRP